MAPPTPQLLSRNGNGPTPVTSSSISTEGPKAKPKTPATGEKIVIRRLPPAITESEFQIILGDEWAIGNGKVDWCRFDPGKISKDPSKLPIPARAYLHVISKDDLTALSQAVSNAAWEDAANSFNHPSYMGPPIAEYALYKKVPSGKKKEDPRQGTIDVDPDFMAFLEELANPPAKPEDNNQGDVDDRAESKVTTTPLIEAIREKKAAKARETANAKSTKQARGDSSAATKDKKKSKDKSDKGDKGGKPKETVKILTKKAAAEAAADAAKAIAAQLSAASTSSAAQDTVVPTTTPKSRRAGIAAAARILQRDLGLSPGTAHRRARLDAAKADAEAKAAVNKENVALPAPKSPQPDAATASTKQTSQPSTPTAPKAQQPAQSSKKGKGKGGEGKGKTAAAQPETPATPAAPVILLKKDKSKETSTPPAAQSTSTGTTGPAAASSTTVPPPTAPTGPKASAKGPKTNAKSTKKAAVTNVTPGMTRGFVKHANPSQGITEPLLKVSLEQFGTVTFVEIDRRKGFAYVDFADHEGLVKAIQGSPISVAQGTVQVLERREKPASSAKGGGANEKEKKAGDGEKGKGKEKEKEKQQQPEKDKEAAVAADAPAGLSNDGSQKGGEKAVADGQAAGGGGGRHKGRRGGRGRGGRGKEGAASASGTAAGNNNAAG